MWSHEIILWREGSKFGKRKDSDRPVEAFGEWVEQSDREQDVTVLDGGLRGKTDEESARRGI